MKRLMVMVLCCVVFLMGCSAAGQNTRSDLDMMMDRIGDEPGYALYVDSYDTIDELMEAAVLVVRATPTQVESESKVGICWVLDVAESSQPGVETIRLRQMKDEYQLELGQEVVLALGQEDGDSDYYILGGGCGLFYLDPATGALDGELLDSLQERSADADAQTLDDAFRLLTKAVTNE